MEMQLLAQLRRLQAWLYVFFLAPALAFAQVADYEPEVGYYERGWGAWGWFWLIAAIVAVLAVIGWAMSRRGGPHRRVTP